LTFQGHVTSLVMWPFDAPYSISYRRSVVTDSLSPAVFEILGPKHIGVTTLTFQSHVTASITWRFDSPYRFSYWCSIGIKSLSPIVFEIFDPKVPVQSRSSLRMRDITWPVLPMQNLATYLNFPPHIAYSLWHLYWAPMNIKGCLLVRPPMLNAKSSENFLSPDHNWANFGGFGGLGVRGFKNFRFLLQQDNVRTNTESIQCHHVCDIAYVAPALRGHVTSSISWPIDSP